MPPRHSRRALLIPFVLFGIAAVAVMAWWVWLAGQVEGRFEARAELLRAQGWRVEHQPLKVSGFPFRVRLELDQPRIVSPSGQGVSAPRLLAEATTYNPDRWLLVAPDGLMLERPGKGRLAVAGDALRLSVSHLRRPVPDLRVDLVAPTFSPQPGAEPFPIAAARRVQFEVRPHRGADAAVTRDLDALFVLTGARGRPSGPVEAASRSGDLDLALEGALIQADRLDFARPGPGGVFAAWASQGGAFTDVRGSVKAGQAEAVMQADRLGVDADGRLSGVVRLSARRPQTVIEGLARSGQPGGEAQVTSGGDRPIDIPLRFERGRTWLGLFPIAPAPRLP